MKILIPLVVFVMSGNCGRACAQQRIDTPTSSAAPVARRLAPGGQTLVEDRYFHCAGTPGHSTKQLFRLPVLEKGVLLAMATIHMNRVLSDERWDPTASIGFNEEGRRSAIRLQMHYEANRPDEVHFTLSTESEKGVEHRFVVSVPRSPRGFPITLKWLPEGGAVAIVGVKSIQVSDLVFKPNILELACSTGDFEFTAVTLLSE